VIIPDHPDDLLLDEKFVPCRDDRCPIDELHAEHSVPMRRGRQIRRCPICNSTIIRIPRKWACCSKCSWRLTNKPNEDRHA
jgi:hypothetical protein